MKKSKYPLVSIIILNWNGGRVFEDCLRSLAKIKYPKWELIVVDNGSTDGSESLAKLIKSAKLIKNKKNVGFAPGNNQGYKKSKGDYLLLLNNDTKATPDFLTKLVDRMREDVSIGVLQPKIIMTRKPGRLDNTGSFMTRIGFLEHQGFGKKDGKKYSKEKEVFSCKGACMLIRREVIEKVGLFDESFKSYFEESDFCWRVWLAGWKVKYYPKAKIYHRVGYTIRRLDVVNINYDYYRNRITSIVKNFGIRNLATVLPAHLFVSIGISGAFLLKRQIRSSFMILEAIFYNFRMAGDILEKRKKVQSMRVVSDEELFGPLMHSIDWKRFYGDFKRVDEDIQRKRGEDA